MEGMGEEKLYFLLLKSVKCKKNPGLGQSVSTHFVADCTCSFVSTPTKNECNTQIAI